MPEKDRINIMWFRRDLRLHDNTALFHALSNPTPVLPLFIFDTDITHELKEDDARINFIYLTLKNIQTTLQKAGSSLLIKKGKPLNIFKELTDNYVIENLYCNNDYEPYAKERDSIIKSFAESRGIGFHSYKDHVIFEKAEIVKQDSSPYTVYTPYAIRWREKLAVSKIALLNSIELSSHFYKTTAFTFPDLATLGFKAKAFTFPEINWGSLYQYKEKRDFPSLDATSKISLYLRFGTISIREVALKAIKKNDTFLGELIWREFFMMILHHFPRVQTESFKKRYDLIEWDNNEEMFALWCQGRTGYPLVDAGMRELNATGFMHNRVRMVVAGFLTKHLLTDWRWGEHYFAEKLLDYELSSNNGNWQWAAGTGCDAAPYFRIFNPTLQAKKFDKDTNYIKKWIPEYLSPLYPKPIVVHEVARKRCLLSYGKAIL